MKLALSTLLASIALLSPQALALGESFSIDLQYGVRDAQALYGVATANGDLRLFNQGPSATLVRWFDPLRGEEEERVLEPGQVLLSQGHLGVPVSEGTIVLLEKLGQGPISIGLASLPSSASMHDSVHCLHNNGAFLPWHRGYFASVDTLVGGTMCSIESYRGALGVLSSSATEGNFLLGDGSVRFLVPTEGDDIFMPLPGVYDCNPNISGGTDGDDIFMPNAQLEISSAIWTQTLNLEHGPGLHDSIHCIVGGTMCSARASDDPVYSDQVLSFTNNCAANGGSGVSASFSHHANIDSLLMVQTLELESGQPLPLVISLEGFTQPTEGDDIFMPNADSFFAGIPSCPELEHASGMSVPHGISLPYYDSMYIDDASSNLGGLQGSGTYSLLPCVQSMEAQGWEPCPPYEPVVSPIWTSGTASIWTSGTASIWRSNVSIVDTASDINLVDQLTSLFHDGHVEE